VTYASPSTPGARFRNHADGPAIRSESRPVVIVNKHPVGKVMPAAVVTAIEPIVDRLRRGPFSRGSGVLAVYTIIMLAIATCRLLDGAGR